jgi:S1-C subfamily serine protease
MGKIPLLVRHPAFCVLLGAALVLAAQGPAGAAGHPSLGLLVQAVPFGDLQQMGLSHGIVVRGLVTGGPAAKAGIRPGDIIVDMNKAPVYSSEQLEWLVTHLGPKDKASVTYVRDGKKHSATIEPVAAVAGEPSTAAGPAQEGGGQQQGGGSQQGFSAGQAYLGIGMQPLTGDLGPALGAPQGRGVLVAQVAKDGPAAKAGVQTGDILIGIGKKKIRGITDVYGALSYFEPGDKVKLEIVRDKKTEALTVTLGQSPEGGMGWRQGPGPYGFHGSNPMQPYGPAMMPPDFGRCMQAWRDCMENRHEMHHPVPGTQQQPGYNL